MLASSSTIMSLLIVAYVMAMGGNFGYAFMMYHRGNPIWKGNVTIAGIMLLMMILSLL